MFKPCQHRNAAAAFRHFEASPWAGVHEEVLRLLRHRAAGALIALMSLAGFLGWLYTYVL